MNPDYAIEMISRDYMSLSLFDFYKYFYFEKIDHGSSRKLTIRKNPECWYVDYYPKVKIGQKNVTYW